MKTRIYLVCFILIFLNCFFCYGSNEKWDFIVYGDTRSNDVQHRKVLNSMRRNSPSYQFIINVGDIVNNGTSTSQWNTWKSAVEDELGPTGQESTPPKYMGTPGNHDKITSSKGRANWRKYLPGQTRYGNGGELFYFDYKDARFIVLNSEKDVFSKQMHFLIDVLKKKPKKWMFAF